MSIITKARKIFVACLLILFGSTSQTAAVGVFLTNEYQQIAPAQAKVAIFHDGQKETLIMSQTFSFNPLVVWNFLWLIPVPARPEIEPINGDLFAGLEKLLASSKREGDKSEQTSLRAASIIRFEIFSQPQELSALEQWVRESGYFLPKSLKLKLDNYWQKGWSFVVAEVDGVHIQRTASDSLVIQNAFVLPLKITFPAKELIIPLEITGAQPDLDSEAVPLSFAYGIPSAQVLGITNEAVDAELAAPSPNKYPRLPLGLLNFRLDLFVFAPSRTELPGFELVADTKIDGRKFGTDSWNNFYLRLPQKKLMLSHLTAYQPFNELRDLVFPVPRQSGPNWLLGSLALLLLLGLLFLVGKTPGLARKTKIIIIGAVVIGAAVLLTWSWPGKTRAPLPVEQTAEHNIHQPAAQAEESLALTSGSYYFAPNVIRARVDEKIRLKIESVDGLHTFTIDELGIDVQTPLGATEIEFSVSNPGTYQFYCAIAGHRAAGQVGTLIVD